MWIDSVKMGAGDSRVVIGFAIVHSTNRFGGFPPVAMKITRLLSLVALATVLGCCAHGRYYTVIDDQELVRCKKAAIEAAASPDAWRSLGGERLTTEPFKFNYSQLKYEINFDTPDRVRVILPSGGRFGEHFCFVAVTIALKDFTVLEMHENCWP